MASKKRHGKMSLAQFISVTEQAPKASVCASASTCAKPTVPARLVPSLAQIQKEQEERQHQKCTYVAKRSIREKGEFRERARIEDQRRAMEDEHMIAVEAAEAVRREESSVAQQKKQEQIRKQHPSIRRCTFTHSCLLAHPQTAGHTFAAAALAAWKTTCLIPVASTRPSAELSINSASRVLRLSGCTMCLTLSM